MINIVEGPTLYWRRLLDERDESGLIKKVTNAVFRWRLGFCREDAPLT